MSAPTPMKDRPPENPVKKDLNSDEAVFIGGRKRICKLNSDEVYVHRRRTVLIPYPGFITLYPNVFEKSAPTNVSHST